MQMKFDTINTKIDTKTQEIKAEINEMKIGLVAIACLNLVGIYLNLLAFLK